LSDARTASRSEWLPNRMFDPVNNPFAMQNLLRKEPDAFTLKREKQLQKNFVADPMVAPQKSASAASFKTEHDSKSEAEPEPESRATDWFSLPDEEEIVAQADFVGPLPREAMPEMPEEMVLSEAEKTEEPLPLEEVVAVAEAEPEVEVEPESEVEVAAGPDLSSEAVTSLIDAAREEARSAASKEGFDAGYAQARADLQALQDAQITILKQLCDGVKELSQDADAMFEPLQKLAMHLAEQLVRGELSQSGQAIARLVDNCLRELAAAGDKPVVVHLNPEDLELYRPLVSQFGDSMTLRSSTDLKRGSVRVALDGSVVEDLIERRIAGLKKTMAQPPATNWRSTATNSLPTRMPQVIEDVTPIEANSMTVDASDA
jgi:flagellar biosynthesis/type III secretory pathway protein FliH